LIARLARSLNQWPPILLHVGLNGLWLVFGLGDDAIGGGVGNGLRLGIVLVAIVATTRLAPGANAATAHGGNTGQG
jgi:hypothetical protein